MLLFYFYTFKLFPVGDGWTVWTEWSDCSADCEKTGNSSRRRTCIEPIPHQGGADCERWSQEDVHCQGSCLGWFLIAKVFS